MNQASRGFFPITILVMALAMATMKCNMRDTTGSQQPYKKQVKSNDSSLKSLTLSGNGTLNRKFKPKLLNYTYKVSESVESITLTPEANSKKSKITINDKECRSNEKSESITLNVGENEISIQVTAENGDEKEYTVVVERLASEEEKNDDAALSSLMISGASLQPDFNPETHKYTASMPETKVPLDVTATTRSADATITFTLDGEEVENQREIDFSGAKVTLVAEVTAGDGSTKGVYTIVVTRRADPSKSSVDLKDIEITFGTENSKRPIYHSFKEPNKTTFDPDITNYAAVVYACKSITLRATAQDPSITSIVFNDDTDGTHTNGVKTGSVELTAGIGKVTNVTISVTGSDGSSVKKYNLSVKLLNADEFIFGIFGKNYARSYLRWWEVVPNPGPGTNETIKGYVSGKLNWWVEVRFLRGKNNMKWTDYCDGNDDHGSVLLYTPYNDNTGVDSLDGFVVNGTLVGDVNLQGDGLQTGTMKLTTPWGDKIGSIYFHVYLENKEPVTKEGSGSYMTFTYMGEKYKYSDLADNKNPDKLPYPFTPDYDWNTPWKREK